MQAYEDTIARTEFRWIYPQSKKVIDHTIKVLKEAGVKGWVCSGVNGKGLPLFPSKVYSKAHKDANLEWLSYLLEQAEINDITVISWYPLNLAKPVVEKYPEYRIQFLDFPYPRNKEWEQYYACVNSPYLDILEEFVKELIKLGFKGIWFDGNTISNHNTQPMFQPGCYCRYCTEKFKKDTGLEIPIKIDFENTTFKVWVNWRYKILENAWKRLTEAVKSANPEATVCLNNYRRKEPGGGLFNWNTGIPLNKLNIDLLMSSELDGFMQQADFQIKLGKATQCYKGAETWVPLRNYWGAWLGNPEKITMVQGALGAFSAGGNVLCGTDNIVSAENCMKEISSSLKSVYEYKGGDLKKYAAIWVSQQTMDFEGKMDATPIWNSYHGANEMLNNAHLQTSIVFDDYVTDGDIFEYPVLLVNENTCITDKQWDILIEYVKRGGLLVACGEFSSKNEMGEKRDKNLLFNFLGIEGERVKQQVIYKDIREEFSLGEYPKGIYVNKSFVKIIPIEDRLADEVKVICQSQTHNDEDLCPGILVKPLGKGNIIYCNSDIFTSYLEMPISYKKDLMRKIITYYKKAYIDVEAPLCVTVNVFEKDGNIILQIHNNPGQTYRYPNLGGTIGEVLPIYNIEITLNVGGYNKAYLPRWRKTVEIENNSFVIDKLNLHETVVVAK